MISVLIPARNEADRIGSTIAGVRAALRALGSPAAEILVIDDGSTDATADEAAAAGADRVDRMPANRGKGAALNAGLAHARGQIIVTVDADLEGSAAELAAVIAPVLAGQADMTIATLPKAGRSGGFGLALRLARWAIRRSTGQDVEAPLSGQRAIRREVLDALGGFAGGFGTETALTLDALRRGCRVLSVPTQIRHRALGRTVRGFLHRGRQLVHIAAVVLQRRAWRRMPVGNPIQQGCKR